MLPLFTTPWVPCIRNNALAPCALIAYLVDDMVGPSPRNDEERAWTFAANRSVLEGVPDAKAAILETLTAIWRLSQEEERGATDEEWANHLEVWLVRCDLSSSPREFSSPLFIESICPAEHRGWDLATGGRHSLRSGCA